MKATRTWIVVADGARARILLNDGPGKGIQEIASFDSATHAPTRELGTDRPGRVNDSLGGQRHAIEPRVDWHSDAKQQFARQITQYLEDNARRHSYDQLVLVAPPKTLGDLRAGLAKNSASLIISELAKDLTHVAMHDLPDHLKEVAPL